MKPTPSTSAGISVGLFQTERQREIVASTIAEGRVEVAELATRFGVTTETIRRDLSELQEQRLLRRVHGGAIAWETSEFEPLLTVRTDQHDEEKRRIAKRAVAELPDSGTIIIDSGSTLGRFAEAVPSDTSLRVVTNSLPIALTLAEHDSLEVITVGGRVRKNTMAMVDAETVRAFDALSVDTLFISTDGLTAEMGLTTPYRQEATLKQAMLRSARRVVALVDQSKFGKNQFVRFAEWSDIDVLVTTAEADGETLERVEALGTTVLQA
ncbi:MAG: DeoR/GlpR family DNA-binding transcription regulator [Actinomycetota bacterium]